MNTHLQQTLRQHPGVELEPVASEEEIAFSEGILGFHLPDELRWFYRNIGNGGKIPEIGWTERYRGRTAWIYGVQGGFDDDEDYIHGIYRAMMSYRRDRKEYSYLFHGEVVRGWPGRLLPFGLWGSACSEFSICLDCNLHEMPVYFYDGCNSNECNPDFPGPITQIYDAFDNCTDGD